MKPRVTVITLGVDDLERSLRFYRDGLQLATEGIIGQQFEHGAVAFFDLQPGLKLAIWPRKSLAHDSGLALGPPSATELSLGHNVSSRRLCRLFPGSRRPSLGGCLESRIVAARLTP